MIEDRRVLAGELLEDHGLADAGVSVQQETRHSGARRVVDQPLQILEGELCAGVANPPSGVDVTDAILGASECKLPNRDVEVRQVQCHESARQVSVSRESIGLE